MTEISEDMLREKGLGSLAPLLGGKSEFKLDKALVKVLFSDEESKIIQTSEFNTQGIRMVTAMEIIDNFIIEPYCYDANKKNQFKTFKKRLYQMQVSKDRKGRQEIFDSLKSTMHLTLKDDKEKREIK